MTSYTTIFQRLNDDSDESKLNQFFILDANMDKLSFLELDLENLQNRLNKKLAYWQDKKRALLAENLLIEEIESVQQQKLKELFQKALAEFKGLFQAPGRRLQDIFVKTSPNLFAIQKHLNETTDKLSKLPKNSNNPNTKTEKNRLNLEICNTSINLLQGSMQLIQDVAHEIKLRTTLEDVTEKVVLLAINLVTFFVANIIIPVLNIGFTGLYRNYLYKEVQADAYHIVNYTTQNIAEVNRADKASEPLFFAKSSEINKQPANDEILNDSELEMTAVKI